MEYGKTGNPKIPHRFTFKGWEVTVVRAAYTESTIHRELKGNSSSVSEFDALIVNHPKSKKQMVLYPASATSIAEVLEEFVERTDSEAADIAHLPMASFENNLVARRRELGQWAVELAREIRETADREPTLAEAESQILEDIRNLPDTTET